MSTDEFTRRAFLRLDWLRGSGEDGDADDADETTADEAANSRPRTPAPTDSRRSGVDDRPTAD